MKANVVKAKKKTVTGAKKPAFNVETFLTTASGGRTIAKYRKGQRIFRQGEPADAVFYVQEGEVKVCVISEQGKEAVVALHRKGDFFGEGCLTGQPRRLATVAAMTECTIMRLDKAIIVRALHDEPKFSERFTAYLLARTARVEADLVDQLFNSSERRLARALLLIGEFWQGGKARAGHYKNQPGDTCGHGRHDAVAREYLHEQIPQTGIHQVQRGIGSPQFPADHGST